MRYRIRMGLLGAFLAIGGLAAIKPVFGAAAALAVLWGLK